MKFKVFLINLDKSTDRLQHCAAKLDKLNIQYERFSAIDGTTLTEEQRQKVYCASNNITAYKKDMSDGEICCYLSHMALWKKIIEEELDYAIILEDDFELDDKFPLIHDAIAKIKDWDYIRLANTIRKTKIRKSLTIDSNFALVRFNKVPINTLAQAISKQGAEKLIKNHNSIARPIDVDLKHYWEKNIDVIGIVPPVVLSQDAFESDISKISKGKGREVKSSVMRNLKFVSRFFVKNTLNSLLLKDVSHYLKP